MEVVADFEKSCARVCIEEVDVKIICSGAVVRECVVNVVCVLSLLTMLYTYVHGVMCVKQKNVLFEEFDPRFARIVIYI